jgi:signal transduction histidine kinase
LKTKDGRIIWIEDNARYIKDEHGKVLFNEGICRDITDRKHAEEELKRKNDELLKLNMEKDKFFSIIAHDLRSPFNGFLGLTQIMAEKLSDLTMDEIQRFAVSLRKSATNLFRLLENLLEWSRLEQGLIPFRPASVELRKVSEQSIEMITETAKIKGVGILNNISPGLMVFADTNLLQTVLRNLVSNAVKYTRNGGTINLYAKALTNNTVEISIVDSGIGMSPDLLEKLFRLDDQKSRKGTDGEPSTGLGLIICKDFISKHGGTICVESEEGSGSTFYITLPIPPSVKTELTTNVCNVNC